MTDLVNQFEANRVLWNARVQHHLDSKMYDVEGFVAGRNSLTAIELDLLGEVNGKRILHLQCHFGQDTLSLARMGASVTGLDISDKALDEAKTLTARCGLQAEWVLSNVIEPVEELDGQFDVVYTSYGTIGWLPDLKPWAANIARYLKPGGQLVFVEFHPAVWMFDNAFTHVQYSYFNREVIAEEEQGTYADRDADVALPSYGWNHGLGEVLTALLDVGLRIERFVELDGSPHDCFANTVQGTDGLYRIKGMEGKLPMVYGLTAQKRQ
ncbi:MAG TPA: methyltransferase domain-containing protein [Flavobacteriales bacterium]|jgi:2-polyprenyl-3-methyl-5-hydroxy-6-metoxy-1,4-benzoquinol methylase|nr:methyltransferase domain-containing protein [Flavobacteriales bacterium]MBK7100190.1 methyltransferase domain-containing protein [Flavobacteriales bacterium]MBK7110883.1 methyltransferase domain-containing protein [Flavobacteriales bacterium]MBK8707155.1 methyltransferase domain-containing protein [Flavobacteriales bacterium]MBK9628401.1 methyltransferase domain-containing protein [Flavobacteriales bacterium]